MRLFFLVGGSITYGRKIRSEKSLLKSRPHCQRNQEELERIPEMSERRDQELDSGQDLLLVVIGDFESVD
jgi:hypothetical protein